MGRWQAGVVLQNPSHLRRAHESTCARRSIQLRRWIRKLAGRLVCGQKGVVLQSTWQRLPQQRWWLHHRWHHITTIRLCGRIRQLDGRLERGEESLVLPERR